MALHRKGAIIKDISSCLPTNGTACSGRSQIWTPVALKVASTDSINLRNSSSLLGALRGSPKTVGGSSLPDSRAMTFVCPVPSNLASGLLAHELLAAEAADGRIHIRCSAYGSMTCLFLQVEVGSKGADAKPQHLADSALRCLVTVQSYGETPPDSRKRDHFRNDPVKSLVPGSPLAPAAPWAVGWEVLEGVLDWGLGGGSRCGALGGDGDLRRATLAEREETSASG